jgi:hypothetical protein
VEPALVQLIVREAVRIPAKIASLETPTTEFGFEAAVADLGARRLVLRLQDGRRFDSARREELETFAALYMHLLVTSHLISSVVG